MKPSWAIPLVSAMLGTATPLILSAFSASAMASPFFWQPERTAAIAMQTTMAPTVSNFIFISCVSQSVSAENQLEFFQRHRRAADALRLQGDTHLYPVGDLDKGDAARHPILLAVESHGSLDLAFTGPNP